MSHTKVCSNCDEELDISEFKFRPGARAYSERFKRVVVVDNSLRESVCRGCRNKRHKEVYNERRQKVVDIMRSTCSICGNTHADHKAFTILPVLPKGLTAWRAIFRIVEANPENWHYYYKLVCQTCLHSTKS